MTKPTVRAQTTWVGNDETRHVLDTYGSKVFYTTAISSKVQSCKQPEFLRWSDRSAATQSGYAYDEDQ